MMFSQFRVIVFRVRVFLGCFLSVGCMFLGLGFSHDDHTRFKIEKKRPFMETRLVGVLKHEHDKSNFSLR